MKLVLVTNIFEKCREGVVFPESESRWTTAALESLVRFASIPFGYGGKNHYDVVQLLLQHIGVHRPPCYTMYVQDGEDRVLITNPSGIQIRDGMLKFGTMTQFSPIPPTAKCVDIWNLSHQRQFVVPVSKATRVNDCTVQMQEANMIVNALTSEVETHKSQVQTLTEKNSLLEQQNKVNEAKFIELTERYLALQRQMRR